MLLVLAWLLSTKVVLCYDQYLLIVFFDYENQSFQKYIHLSSSHSCLHSLCWFNILISKSVIYTCVFRIKYLIMAAKRQKFTSLNTLTRTSSVPVQSVLDAV